jgi:hypothetical protein
MNKQSIFLLISVLILFVFFYLILGFDGMYGQDGYEYLRYTKAIRIFILEGEHPGDYFWPLYYPIIGAILSLIISKTALALQLVSVLSLGVSAVYLNKILTLLFPKKKYTAEYVFVFFVLSPFVLRSALIVMSDMLSLLFLVLSIYFFVKYKESESLKNYYNVVLFSFLAVMTRYACAVIVLPFILSASFLFLKKIENYKHILFILVIVAFLFLPHYYIRYQNTTSFLNHQWLQTWSFSNFFKSNFSTVDGVSHNKFNNLLYAVSNFIHPYYIFTGILFLPILIFKNKPWKYQAIIIISLLLNGLFLAGIPFQNFRFLLLSFPLALVLFYPIFYRLIIYVKKKKSMQMIWVVISLIQILFIYKSMNALLNRNFFEKKMTKELEVYQNKTLYSFDIDIALQGRGLVFEYKNLWVQRYYNLSKNDLVLFHPVKFKKQWDGKNPILNYDYFMKNYQLEIEKELPDGWRLYIVKNRFNLDSKQNKKNRVKEIF